MMPRFAFPTVPGAGSLKASRLNQRIRRPRALRVADDVGLPGLDEAIDGVVGLAGVGREDRVVRIREIRRQELTAAGLEDRRDRPAARQRVRPRRHRRAEAAVAAERHFPRAVHHEAMTRDVRIGTAIGLDVVRVVLHDAERRVAEIGRVRIAVGERVRRLELQAVGIRPAHFQLHRVERAAAGVLARDSGTCRDSDTATGSAAPDRRDRTGSCSAAPC